MLLICDQLLDEDIQPSPEDFSVCANAQPFTVQAVHLKSPMQEDSSWSVISLQVDRPIPEFTEIEISYSPTHWLLWSLVHEKPLAPFEFLTLVSDQADIDGLSIQFSDLRNEFCDDIHSPEHDESHYEIKAVIKLAIDHCVQITFDKEFNMSNQPRANDFRADCGKKWLNISTAYLTKPSRNSLPELWIVLDELLESGTRLQIDYKAQDRHLKTVDGDAITAFSTSITVLKDKLNSDPVTRSVQDSALPNMPKESASKNNIHENNIQEQNTDEKNCGLDAFDEYMADLVEMSVDSGQSLPESGNSPVESEHEIDTEEQAGDSNSIVDTNSSDTNSGDTNDTDTVLIEQSVLETVGTDDTTEKSEQLDVSSLPTEPNLPFITPQTAPQTAAELQSRQQKRIDRILTILMLMVIAAIAWMVLMLAYFFLQLFGESSSTNEMCRLKLANGAQYEGLCRSGKPHGTGEMQTEKGKRIVGQWQNGNLFGSATITWSNGARYVGGTNNGKQHGTGTLSYGNGDIYEGQFENDLKHGYGTMTWASGAKYKGNYEQGKANGNGTFWNVNGSRFEGTFKNGGFTEQGTCYYSNGKSSKGACTQ